ncbi:MAG TPA: transglycosylase SLT domain-containing protein [Amycolatopsis sp.]|nr:transglycosylase SLT domain-containing protein [Amycolatopsis sp.]
MSGCPDRVSFDADQVRRVAQEIGRLMDDTSAFGALSNQSLNGGQFDAALWLRQIVQNRKQGLLQHVQDLKSALEDIGTSLQDVVNDLQRTDGQNAADVRRLLDQDMGALGNALARDAPELGFGTNGVPPATLPGQSGDPPRVDRPPGSHGGATTGEVGAQTTALAWPSGGTPPPGPSADAVPNGGPVSLSGDQAIAAEQTGMASFLSGTAVSPFEEVPAVVSARGVSSDSGIEPEDRLAGDTGSAPDSETSREEAQSGAPQTYQGAQPASTPQHSVTALAGAAPSIKTVAEPTIQPTTTAAISHHVTASASWAPEYAAAGEGFAPAPSGDLADWIHQATDILRANGMPVNNADVQLIATIIQHESGGDPSAVNLWDGNAQAGHPSIGLMQCIDTTFDAYKLPGHNNIENPVDNIIAGVRYAVARYGSLSNVPGIASLSQGGSYVGY